MEDKSTVVVFLLIHNTDLDQDTALIRRAGIFVDRNNRGCFLLWMSTARDADPCCKIVSAHTWSEANGRRVGTADGYGIGAATTSLRAYYL